MELACDELANTHYTNDYLVVQWLGYSQSEGSGSALLSRV